MKKGILILTIAFVALALLFAGCSQPNPPVVPGNETNNTNGTMPGNATNETWTMEQSREIAREFVLRDETYAFDGMGGMLELVSEQALRCVGCWEFVFSFNSTWPGYGNRTGMPVPTCGGNGSSPQPACMMQPTRHEARVQVERGVVANAFMDGQWDMISEASTLSSSIDLNTQLDDVLGNPWAYNGRAASGTGVLVNLVTNYFTDHRFALNMSGKYIEVAPWMPLEVAQCPQDQQCNRPAVMSDLLGKEVELYGNLKPGPDGIWLGVYNYREHAGEGEFCGGIAAFPCATGLQCQLDGSYPDAGGKCVKKAMTLCPSEKPSVCPTLHQPVCAEIHIYHPDMAPTYVTWHKTEANGCSACAGTSGTSVVVGYVDGRCE